MCGPTLALGKVVLEDTRCLGYALLDSQLWHLVNRDNKVRL